MKVLQLNIWNGRLEKQIAELLDHEKPDIICLQEAISLEGGPSGMFITIEDIQAAQKLKYSSIAPVFSFNYMHRTARFSNCILSHSPIHKSEVVFTNWDHHDNFDFNQKRANMRNFIHSVIGVGGQQLNVLTHHGYHIPDHKNGDVETMRQMKQMGEYIDGLKGPVILTGDFNLAPHSESLEQINHRLINLPLEHHLETTRTILTPKKEVCDYIFVSEDVKVKNFYASDELASDHKALILDFDI